MRVGHSARCRDCHDRVRVGNASLAAGAIRAQAVVQLVIPNVLQRRPVALSKAKDFAATDFLARRRNYPD